MSKWEKVKLVDVCDFQGGSQPPKEQWIDEAKDGYIRMLQIRDFTQNRVGKEEYIKISKNIKTCDDSDILIARYGASLGKILVGLSGAYNVAIMKTIPDIKVLSKKYLRVFLLSNIFQNYIANVGSRAAQAGFNKTDLEDLFIPLPPIETQKQIAKTLDTAEELLAMRKQQFADLDNLIKVTFYDMFGDPINNEKGWELKHIGDFSKVKIGPFGSLLHVEDYIENGFPLVNPSHIVGNQIVPDMNLTLSPEKFSELKSYVMEKGDIVVGRRGEIGRCAVVENEGFLCGTGSMFIRIENDYLPMVLQRVISSDSMRSILEHQSVGVTMKNLNAGTISNLVVPMIPLLLQTQFANIVTKIEEQKAIVKQAIDETQHLFDSLMSEYFE